MTQAASCRIVIKFTALYGVGWLIIALNLIALLAIYANTFLAITFNSALALLFAGSAMVTSRKMPRLSQCTSIIVFLFGSLTLIDYIFNINFGLGHNLSYIPTKRMAPNTALFITVMGITLFLNGRLSSISYNPTLNIIIFALSLFIAAAGLIALGGYFLHFPPAYGWGEWSQMSLYAAFEIALIGMGLALYLGFEHGLAREKRNILFPSLIIAGGGVIFILLWQILAQGEQQEAAKLNQIISIDRFNALNAEISWIPLLSLVIGLSVTILLAVSVRMLQIARERTLELKESESKFRLALDSILDAALLVDAKGAVVFCNEPAVKLFEYPEAALVGQTVEALMPERFRKNHVQSRENYMKAPIKRPLHATKNIFILTRSAQEIPVEIGLNPITIKNEEFVLCSIHDIREAKQNEEKLLKQTRSFQIILDIIRAIANEENYEVALKHCLSIICLSIQWPIGHIYYTEEGDGLDTLIPSDIWYLAHPEQVQEFYRITMKTKLTYGVGLPGMVLVKGGPVWMDNVSTDPNFPRALPSIEFRIHNAFAFPLKVDGKIVAIFEFFSFDHKPEDENLMQLMSIISNQISLFIDRLQALEKNKTLARRFEFAVEAGKIGVWELDLKTNDLTWDKQMFRLYGIDPVNFRGKYEDWEHAVHRDDLPHIVREFRESVAQNKLLDSEFRIIKPNHEVRYIHVDGTVILGEDGLAKAMLGVNFDVTDQKNLTQALSDKTQDLEQLNRKLEKYAYYDFLTGVMNRNSFEDAAKRLISRAKRHHYILCLMFLDLDFFKKVNDQLGHHVGDTVLIETTSRLVSHRRKEDLVARVGGDEFVYMGEIKSPSVALEMAEKIKDEFKAPFQVNHQSFMLTISIGIAYFPKDGEELAQLLHKADRALLQAKETGRNKIVEWRE